MGANDIVDFICRQDRNPGWSWDNWIAFAMSMGLVRREDEGPVARTANALRRSIDEYRTRCQEFLSQQLPVLVGTSVTGSTGSITSDQLVGLLEKREHVQLVGESGNGKSHLARHMAVSDLRSGGLVIWVAARDFEDKLSGLLNRSVAHLHPGTATELLEIAQKTGTRVSVILDGFNECPARLQARLRRDLQAFVLRWPVPIIVTTQKPVSFSKDLSGATYQFAVPTDEQRKTVLQSYLTEPASVGVFGLCGPFRTPYELSLAAEVIDEIGESCGRAALFSAYVRHRCEGTSNSLIARQLLVAIAAQMHDCLKSSLEHHEIWQIAQRTCDRHGIPSQLLLELVDARLLVFARGRCSFQHEVLERFLQAEAILSRSEAGVEFGKSLQKPRLRPLASLVIGLLASDDAARSVLRGLARADVLEKCLDGECGEVPQQAAIAECLDSLSVASRALDGLELNVEIVRHESTSSYRVKGGIQLPPNVLSGLNAIGRNLTTGRFLERAFLLAQQSDDACHQAIERAMGRKPTKAMLHSLYYEHFVLHGSDLVLPSGVVYHASKMTFRDYDEPALSAFVDELDGTLAQRSVGELFLLCNVLQLGRNVGRRLLPELLRACWDSGLYHLRTESLHVATFASETLSNDTRGEVKAILASLIQTDNLHPFLSTSIVDAMLRYDMIESPITVDGAYSELASILADFDDPSAQEDAYQAVTRVFEEVYRDAYWEAIERLGETERSKLLTMAALGATESELHLDWILRQLLKTADRLALPAFLRWATFPDKTPFPQDATAGFLAAIMGCAKFMDKFPMPRVPETDDQRAWTLYGEIVFWQSKPEISAEQLRSNCEPLWHRLKTEFPFQSIDPLEQFASAGWKYHPSEETVSSKLVATFPHEVRSVLEFGLKNQSRLTSIFDYRFRQFEFLVQTLERVGNEGSVTLLENLLDIPDIGDAAASAIRAIRSR